MPTSDELTIDMKTLTWHVNTGPGTCDRYPSHARPPAARPPVRARDQKVAGSTVPIACWIRLVHTNT